MSDTLLALQQGFHLSRVLLDWMHISHMGVCRDFCGAMLYDLCSEGFVDGSSLNNQLRTLWLEMRVWLAKHNKKCPRRVLETCNCYIDTPGTLAREHYHMFIYGTYIYKYKCVYILFYLYIYICVCVYLYMSA